MQPVPRGVVGPPSREHFFEVLELEVQMLKDVRRSWLLIKMGIAAFVGI